MTGSSQTSGQLPQSDPKTIRYAHALASIPVLGAARLGRLFARFTDLEEAWAAPYEQLTQAGLEPNIAEEVVIRRTAINPEQKETELQKLGLRLLTLRDSSYPERLRHIANPPAVLYVRGEANALHRDYAVAIVGTRKVSGYGKQVAPMIAEDLARAGIAVVSGLALGVDGLAHRAALEAGGITVAVLGSGADRSSTYPGAHQPLADLIADSKGAVVSEFPPGTQPLKMHVPFRNRIIAGLTLGTVVIEADETSGALITAQSALDADRMVFAVPGSIFNPLSRGPNQLIKLGAKPVVSAADILEELNIDNATEELAMREIVPATEEEIAILKHLTAEPLHVNDLIRSTGLSAGVISATLSVMELKGIAKHLGSLNYVRSRTKRKT